MRVDLYSFIHKAQRFHLNLLSNKMGKTDFADAAAADEVRAGLGRLIEHLRDHATNEETYVHPLYRKLGGTADVLEKDHHGLEAQLEGLERLGQEERWEGLYPAYTRFLGRYLLHLDEEEKAQAEILWPRCRDEELAAVFNRFKAERAPAAAQADFEFMLPALSVPELARMFQGMKASAPAPAFQGACALAEKMLEPAAWKQVIDRIQI